MRPVTPGRSMVWASISDCAEADAAPTSRSAATRVALPTASAPEIAMSCTLHQCMILYMASDPAASWLLLVISLPTSSATGRMRIWRALKSLGCVALRDGAYLLPSGPGRAEALRELGDECAREGGSAWLMTVTPDSPDDDIAYRQLFDRSEQFAELRTSWKNENRGVRGLSMAELARLKRRLQKEFDALRLIDFFPSEASVEAEATWADFSKRIDTLLSPDEPHETAGRVPRLDPAKYRGRTW